MFVLMKFTQLFNNSAFCTCFLTRYFIATINTTNLIPNMLCICGIKFTMFFTDHIKSRNCIYENCFGIIIFKAVYVERLLYEIVNSIFHHVNLLF
jgi:uncharacterized membrane protein